MAGLNLEPLAAGAPVADHYQAWQKVATALEEKRMPPKGMPQPADADRARAVAWIRNELSTFAKKHDGDPGRVTVRRLTSGEYAYAIRDLTGLDLETGIDASSDSVGGEGFTSFGDVQFMQDANLERYLASAKLIADHAVVGSGPLEFYGDAGKTGFELSAVNRIKAQLVSGARSMDGREQQSAHRPQLAAQAQFAIALGWRCAAELELAAGAQQRQGHGQVVAAPLLRQFHRREVDRDAAGWKVIPGIKNG